MGDAPHLDEARAHAGVPYLSAEVFVVPLEAGRYIVYAPLRRAAFIANARTVNFLADLRAGSLDAEADPDGSLVEFLRGLEILDAGPEQPPVTSFSGQPQPTSLTLFLTTACNLRCTYCYASAGETPTKFMSLDVAKRGIDFVIANAVRRGVQQISITYHGGGEPTVNWRVMCDSLAYARERAGAQGLGVRATTASNGVLSEQQLDWLVANVDGASLSFDGLPSAHDRHRLTVLGQGSSERVMRTMRRFDAAGFSYGVRVTVTRDQISSLPDSVEFICANFRPQRIQVEPAYQMGRWREAPSAETEEFIAAFRAAQLRARAVTTYSFPPRASAHSPTTSAASRRTTFRSRPTATSRPATRPSPKRTPGPAPSSTVGPSREGAATNSTCRS